MWLHQLPGRARARVPGLRGNPRLAAQLEARLACCRGVLGAAASPVTGTVLLRYDPVLVRLAELERVLGAGQTAASREVAAAAEPAVSPPSHPAVDVAAPAPGLTSAEVAVRRAAAGPNLVPEPPRPSFLRRLLDQYQDVMQLTLAAGAGLSLLSGHRRDGLTIGAVLLLNGLIGASQAGSPARSVAALRSLGEQPATVVRDGQPQTVAAADLVPGDLLLLEAGDRVPADADVISAVGLALDESLLTGESVPVTKEPGAGRIAAGTLVVRGRGAAVVSATGATSTLGQIAGLIESTTPPAPLQRRLDGIGRTVAKAGFGLAAGAAMLGLLRGQGLLTSLLSGVSLAISAVPEGLPTFVTLSLAAGARRLSARRASFQNLSAVERLGAVTALCCDKTGTLTQGEMTVTAIALPDSDWRVSGAGYAPVGEFRRCRGAGAGADPLADPGLRRLLMAAALCTNARIGLDENGALATAGDPTEVALLVAALKAGLRASGGEGDRLAELPFDSDRRRMAVICRDGSGAGAGAAVACAKGAPEALLPLCTRVFTGGAVGKLDARLRRRMDRTAAALAAEGLRVLAVAYRPVAAAPRLSPDEAESELILLGLVGMADPPRPEAAETIRRCRQAGVSVLMITGDHPATAAAIAGQLGLASGPGGPGQGQTAVLTGAQLAQMRDDDLALALGEVAVIARAAPEQKLRIVRALKASGQVVAMTGDGVNDAPALREADVGIAMGDRGTAVARATASLILEDDDLRSIAAALEQGRSTRQNIRRTARYLLGSNAAEVCLMAAGLLLGLPLPLLPIQLLWMNLVGDGLPAAALGSEPPAPGLMSRPPERDGALFGPAFTRQIAGHGLRGGLAATALYGLALALGRPLPQARTIAMAALATGQLRHLTAAGRPAGSARAVSPTLPLSPAIRRAAWVTAGLTLGAIYFPPLRNRLQFAPLGLGDLALAAGTAIAVAGGVPPAQTGASQAI